MKFWKWFINLYVSKIKGIKFTPDWSAYAYYVGALGAFFSGIIGFFAFFWDVKWGLIFTGITAVCFVLANYGWYCKKVRGSLTKANKE